MSLTTEQMQLLGVEPVELHVGDSFIHNIQFYKFKDKERYISKWCFSYNEPIKGDNIFEITGFERVEIDGIPQKIRYAFKVSSEIINDVDYIRKYIDYTIDKIIANEVKLYRSKNEKTNRR